MKIVDGRLYIRQVREMITVYTNALARDLTFQNLDEELADPESKYCLLWVWIFSQLESPIKVLAPTEDGISRGVQR